MTTMKRRTLLGYAGAALAEIGFISSTRAKPACRPDGHPSEGKGNECCSGLDDGHTCIADPTNPVIPVTPGGFGVGTPASIGGVQCKTGDTALKCCKRSVAKGCHGEGGDCRKRGKLACKRKFSLSAQRSCYNEGRGAGGTIWC